MAAEGACIKMINDLVGKGADVNTRDHNGVSVCGYNNMIWVVHPRDMGRFWEAISKISQKWTGIIEGTLRVM